MKLYIKTKSGAKFSPGSMSGTVTNEDGIGLVDPSSNYDAKNISPGHYYTFTVNVDNTPDISDYDRKKYEKLSDKYRSLRDYLAKKKKHLKLMHNQQNKMLKTNNNLIINQMDKLHNNKYNKDKLFNKDKQFSKDNNFHKINNKTYKLDNN